MFLSIKLRRTAIFILFLALTSVTLAYSKTIAEGIKNGIELCTSILIPSVFCFLIISDFIVKTGVIRPFLKPLGLIPRILKIEPRFMDVFILSVIGGYPVGAKLIADLVKDKRLDVKNAERMLCFCVNSGPAFVISVVGGVIFTNLNIGVIIFISQFIASIICGFISGLKINTKINLENSFCEDVDTPNFSPLQLVKSVNSSIKVMANICAFVIIFSGLLFLLDETGIINTLVSFTENIFPKGMLKALITGGFEITYGIQLCAGVKGIGGIITACIITAFGGICVHLQILSIISGTGIRLKKFYLYRIIYIFSSVILTVILIRAFNIIIPAFAQNEYSEISSAISRTWIVKPWSESFIVSVLLIILCILLLLSCKKSDKI